MAEEEEIMIMKEEKMSTTTTATATTTTTATATTTTTTTTTLLPQEIITEILSWVPANSLVSSFKLVCKPWRTLINDPVFVKMHLSRRSIHGATSNTSLICKSGNELFQLYPPFNCEGIPPTTDKAAKKLDFGSSLCLKSSLVSSCNGLLCLRFHHDDSIILLNPSTRKYKLPPKQPIEILLHLRKSGPAMFGFACNIDDEYKVIRIVFFSGFDFSNCTDVTNIPFRSQYQFDIYSMSSNSWRRETRNEDFPYVMFPQQSGVFVNGALHWVARYTLTRETSTDSWDTIISFDIKDEEFRQVPIPLSCHPTDDDPFFKMQEVILMNMKGRLSMIHLAEADDNHIDINFEIWVMKEYGIKESWTVEFVIRSSDSYPPRALSNFTICWFSNAYVLKGDQILIEGMPYTYYTTGRPASVKLVLFDINERKIDGDFKRIGVPVPCEASAHQVDYIETLVSLKSLLTSTEH